MTANKNAPKRSTVSADNLDIFNEDKEDISLIRKMQQKITMP